jgi:hypothetical protein
MHYTVASLPVGRQARQDTVAWVEQSIFDGVAQLVEHLFCKQVVEGSGATRQAPACSVAGESILPLVF